MSIKINKSLILNEIKAYYSFSSDAEFARFLNIKPQTLASWHSRNSYDVDLLYAKCEEVDADFLLSGKGEVSRKSREGSHKIAETEPEYKLEGEGFKQLLVKYIEQIDENEERLKTLQKRVSQLEKKLK